MTVLLSSNRVPANAPLGTVIGVLSDTIAGQWAFRLIFSSSFAVSGASLVTAAAPLSPGNYSVIVFAWSAQFFGFDLGVLTIEVTPEVGATSVGLDPTASATVGQPTPSNPGP